MNRNASDDGSDDLLLDWGLNERLGAESPPDLVDAVRARLAGSTAGADGSVAGFARMTRRARFAAAAAVMIGTGVVLGVALWPADRADTRALTSSMDSTTCRRAAGPAQSSWLRSLAR